VYVINGDFVVDVDGQGRKRFELGDDAVSSPMQARHPGATRATDLILFR
jgi:hypothetical protein